MSIDREKRSMWMMPAPVDEVHDGWARALGIPAFGISIPHLTGLFGDLHVDDGMFLVGTIWFIGLAAAVWEGNRALLFAQRKHLDWFQRPLFKIAGLVVACVLYTAPVTLLLLWLWTKISAVALSSDTLVVVALANVICVLFVTHAYETAFLIRGRTEDNERLANLRRSVTEAQLDALRQQVDPHFLFNSLNTLGALIETNVDAAAKFNGALAEVYRYLLNDVDLVTLAEEMEFVRAYASLLEVRFGNALRVKILYEGDAHAAQDEMSEMNEDNTAMVPPTAIQCLVENAVKHTRFNRDQPLTIQIHIDTDCVQVCNPFRPKDETQMGWRESAHVGLKNLDERCELLLNKRIQRRQTPDIFCVTIPTKTVPTKTVPTSAMAKTHELVEVK